MYALLLSAAYQARRHIALVTPYFVPDAALLMALCLAARRGVVVDLLIPARSNHRLSDIARGRALRALAQAGARIWLAPQMLHAKLAVIDDQLALAGSANVDSRSLFLNYEMMIAFHEGEDVRRFGVWFERERQSAQPFRAAQAGAGARRGRRHGAVGRLPAVDAPKAAALPRPSARRGTSQLCSKLVPCRFA